MSQPGQISPQPATVIRQLDVTAPDGRPLRVTYEHRAPGDDSGPAVVITGALRRGPLGGFGAAPTALAQLLAQDTDRGLLEELDVAGNALVSDRSADVDRRSS